MARIQVLPLTTETVAGVSATAFVVIIDKITDADHEMLLPFVLEPKGMAKKIGARQVLIYAGELTVENVDQALHDAATAAVQRALCPERSIGGQ